MPRHRVQAAPSPGGDTEPPASAKSISESIHRGVDLGSAES